MELQKEERLKTSPKDFFLHLLMIATLYVSVIAFIALFFEYINVLYPDPLAFYRESSFSAIRWSTSALIVVFPVFVVLSWLLGREYALVPEKRDLRVRKWLIHFTLFVAAITIIVDLVRLVFNFYGGELTIPFFLKVLAVLVVAGAVFGYYLWDLRRKEYESKIPRLVVKFVSVVVIAAIIAGFFIVGTPGHQRKVRFDERRISDLQVIQGRIIDHWLQKGRLPENLEMLADSISGFAAPADPENGTPYEYHVVDKLSFKLCAYFKTENLEEKTNGGYPQIARPYPVGYYGPEPYNQNWTHGLGRVCFERAIDPELYKPQPSKQ